MMTRVAPAADILDVGRQTSRFAFLQASPGTGHRALVVVLATIGTAFSTGLGLFNLNPDALLTASVAGYFEFMSGPLACFFLMVNAMLFGSILVRVLLRWCRFCCWGFPRNHPTRAGEQSKADDKQRQDNDGSASRGCSNLLLSPLRFYRRMFGGDSDYGVHGKYW